MTGFIIGIVFGGLFNLIVFSIFIYGKVSWILEKRHWAIKLKVHEREATRKVFEINKEANGYFISKNKYRYLLKDKYYETPLMLLTKKGIFIFQIRNFKGHLSGDFKNDFLIWKNINGEVKKTTNSLKLSEEEAYRISNLISEKIPTYCFVIFTSYLLKDFNFQNIPSHIIPVKINNLYDSFASAFNSMESKISNGHLRFIKQKIKKGNKFIDESNSSG